MKGKQGIFCIIFFTFSFGSTAQKNHFNLAVGYGPSYFFNDKTLNRRVDNSKFVGVNYSFTKKNKAIWFNPGIDLEINRYHSQLPHYWQIEVNQHLLGLNLDMFMKLAKKFYLKVGLRFSKVFHSSLYATLNNYNGQGYFSYSNDQLYKNYFAMNFQAGVRAGICFPFKLFKRENKFNVTFFQGASQLVSSDYYLAKAIAGQDVMILSAKARPTMLIFSFDFSLEKRKKKDPDED